jgi:hypothetical protein
MSTTRETAEDHLEMMTDIGMIEDHLEVMIDVIEMIMMNMMRDLQGDQKDLADHTVHHQAGPEVMIQEVQRQEVAVADLLHQESLQDPRRKRATRKQSLFLLQKY